MRRVLLFIIGLMVLGLTGCNANNENLMIKSFNHPTGVYFHQEKINAGIEIFNPTKNEKEVWIELRLYKSSGNQIDSIIENKTIGSGKNENFALEWIIPDELISGNYQTELIVWDQSPDTAGAQRLGESRGEEGFSVFATQDNFDNLDENVWLVSDSSLGRSKLKSDNVSVSNGELSIEIPGNSLNGGEIYTQELKGYGAFETRMKLPNAPSSITGFFLYKAPDYFYEIDIEVYNQPDGTLLLTTYADGEKKNTYVGNQGFDPTKGFHDYRIEYDENQVSFYIDSVFVKSWSDGFPKEGMYLMINSWFPKWLDGVSPKETQILRVDWVRY
ncbi:MAG: glycoside hydrolase family 16 protein [Eubacteriaceae bacterium]|nr:glycoside hydrolase family 16 protein [Eubacteriaceae bacterium]